MTFKTQSGHHFKAHIIELAIDFNALVLEADRFRLLKGYTNLIVNKDAIKEFLQTGAYDLFSHPGQFGLKEAVNGKIQDIAGILAKDYINKFYGNQEKAFLTKYLTYEMLDQDKHQTMFPDAQQLIVKVPKLPEFCPLPPLSA